MSGKVLGAGVFGALGGAWIGRAIFKWVLDVEGTLLLVLILSTAALGVLVCVLGTLEEEKRGS